MFSQCSEHTPAEERQERQQQNQVLARDLGDPEHAEDQPEQWQAQERALEMPAHQRDGARRDPEQTQGVHGILSQEFGDELLRPRTALPVQRHVHCAVPERREGTPRSPIRGGGQWRQSHTNAQEAHPTQRKPRRAAGAPQRNGEAGAGEGEGHFGREHERCPEQQPCEAIQT